MRIVATRLLATTIAMSLLLSLGFGCSGQPESGTQVTESPEVQKQKEVSIKSAMARGAYGKKFQPKADTKK